MLGVYIQSRKYIQRDNEVRTVIRAADIIARNFYFYRFHKINYNQIYTLLLITYDLEFVAQFSYLLGQPISKFIK